MLWKHCCSLPALLHLVVAFPREHWVREAVGQSGRERGKGRAMAGFGHRCEEEDPADEGKDHPTDRGEVRQRQSWLRRSGRAVQHGVVDATMLEQG